MLPCMAFNIVFGRSPFCLTMFYLIITDIHKSMMVPCVPFNIVSGHSPMLPDDVLFDHHVCSQVHDTTMHAI